MITADALAAWLGDNGLPADAGVTTDGQIPAMPDRLVALTRSGGPGTVRERSFELGTVQVICRGPQSPQGSGAAGEELAELVDDILMGAVPPLEIGGRRVIAIDREGGGPAFLDRDAGQRALYVCSYRFEVARAVF